MSKIRKFNVFLPNNVRAVLDGEYADSHESLLSLQALVAVFNLMCLTGRTVSGTNPFVRVFAGSASDVKKHVVAGYSESDGVIDMIARSSRVEVRYAFASRGRLGVDVEFYSTARVAVGYLHFIADPDGSLWVSHGRAVSDC